MKTAFFWLAMTCLPGMGVAKMFDSNEAIIIMGMLGILFITAWRIKGELP